MADLDLLNMQDPSANLPSFLQIAQSQRPQMMPNSPSVFAGMMYGADSAAYDDTIKKAMAQAQLRALSEKQRQDEFSAAAPGRMDEIKLKNQLASGDLGDIDSILAERKQSRKARIDAELAKSSDSQMKMLTNFGVDSWSDADEATKRLMYSQAKNHDLKFGPTHLGDLSYEDFDRTMGHIEDARKSAPSIYGKIGAAEAAGASREKVAQINREAKLDVAKLTTERMAMLQKNKPVNLTMSQWEAQLRQKIQDNTATNKDYEMLTHLVMERETNAKARNDAQPGTPQIPGMPPRVKPVFQGTPPFEPPTPEEGGAPSPSPQGAPQQLPPQAIQILKGKPPGTPTKFGNGQYWTIDPKTGMPVRIK